MNVLIRADASRKTGTGHIMRTLALADRLLAAGHAVRYAVPPEAEFLYDHIARHGADIVVVDPCDGSARSRTRYLEEVDRFGSDWVVLDGYGFTVDDHRSIRATGRRCLVVDDLAALDRWEADIVLNQNMYASSAMYRSAAPHCRLLMGTRYLLLRPEFGRRRTARMPSSNSRPRILVAMGGSDPLRLSSPIVDLLVNANEEWAVTLLAGAAVPEAELRQVRALGPKIDIQQNLADVVPLVLSVDLAVTAAGSSVYEFAWLGVPFVAVLTADNQRQAWDTLRQLVPGSCLQPDELVGTLVNAVGELLRSGDLRANVLAAVLAEVPQEFEPVNETLRLMEQLHDEGPPPSLS